MKLRVLVALLLVAAVGGCRSGTQVSPPGPELVPSASPRAHHLLGFAPSINGPEAAWKYVNLEAQKASYSISLSNLALLNGLNVGVIGSATKTVRITRVKVGPSTATAAGKQVMALIIESPLPTGGAPATGTGYRFDTTDPASSAQWILYTSAPSACPGGCTRLDNPRNEVLISAAATPAFAGNTIEWNLCAGAVERCPVLRSASEIAVVSVSTGGALAGQSTVIEVDWTEE